MSTVTECTYTEVSVDAFDPSEELDEWLETLQTANKTDSFRAVIEASFHNQIAGPKKDNKLEQIIVTGRVEVVGSKKAWKEMDEQAEVEELAQGEADCEDCAEFEFDASEWVKETVAEIAQVPLEAISTSLKLTASGYDGNDKLLGSKTWIVVLPQAKAI